jgi:hypothetical protein
MSADSANLSPLAADLATSLHLSHLQHHAVTNHTHAAAAAAVNNNNNTTTTTAPRIMMKIGGGKDEKRKSEASLDSESDAESLSSGAPATASSTTAAAAAAAAGEAPLPPQKRVRCSTATPLPVPLLVDEPDHDADARRLLPADVAAASSPALLQTPCVARPLPINAFSLFFFSHTFFFRFSFSVLCFQWPDDRLLRTRQHGGPFGVSRPHVLVQRYALVPPSGFLVLTAAAQARPSCKAICSHGNAQATALSSAGNRAGACFCFCFFSFLFFFFFSLACFC